MIKLAVRYDRDFLKEIRKVINSYNSKITRLSRSNENYVLPKKFSEEAFTALRATARTRADVRRRLKDLQSFTARGGEKNIKVGNSYVPKYLHTNIKRYQRLLKVRTNKKMRELETRHPIQNGVEQPFTFSQYGSQEYLTLKAKSGLLLAKDIDNMSIKEKQNYLEKLIANTTERDPNVWKENYIAMLEDSALSYGYDPDKLEVIVERLKKINPENFDDLTFINRNIKEIVYYYKALENIETTSELQDVGEDVISNLDSIYDNLDEILAIYEDEI